MSNTLKLSAIGNSCGVIFPKDLLALLNAEKGDELHYRRTPNGVELTPYDPDLAEQIAVGEEVMRKHRDVLRQLSRN